MKISLSWLRDYLKTEQTALQLVETLTRSGIEVRSITRSGAPFSHVVAAQILESTQHPNADRLSVCKVDDGSGMPRQIVCGAKNYKVGDKVLLALPGAVLPGDFKIKVGKLRGVESEGMMCSAKELNLGEGVEGLLILPPETTVGTEITKLFPSDDIFEIEITPNRPDWLGHIGVAREVAAFNAGEFIHKPSVTVSLKEDPSNVVVAEPAFCTFYSLQKMEGVAVKSSPAWLARRLEAIGARSINNVVDVTNYVMFATAQPVHAFDASKIELPLTIRFANAEEKFMALDGKTYELATSDLVIADAKGPQALAGVIGGLASSVTEATTSILLEAATFDASMVRKTARLHNIITDAAYRFERGANATAAIEAGTESVGLIEKIAGGKISSERIVAGSEIPLRVIQLRNDRCRQLLGILSSDEEITSFLMRLGLVQKNNGWQVPSWRPDLTREIDLIEEVARLHGIEAIEARVQGFPTLSTQADKNYNVAMNLRRSLVGHGFFEARTGTLCSQEEVSAEAIQLRNPMGEQQSFLRTSLLPGLVTIAKHNLSQGCSTLRLFEVGKVFSKNTNPEESLALGIMMIGHASDVSWRTQKERSLDLYDLKGVIDQLVPNKITYRLSDQKNSSLALQLDVFCNNKRAGFVGLLAPAKARKLMVTGQDHFVAVSELDIATLQESLACEQWKTKATFSKFPPVVRDLALIVNDTCSYAVIESVLLNAKEELLQRVIPFDLFSDPSGEKIPIRKKSIAVSLTFQHDGRTLTTEEVSAACERLVMRLHEQLGVEIRRSVTVSQLTHR